jgi:mRNA-degrading endonuclease RelE of RelBE toxin-antitoxin system
MAFKLIIEPEAQKEIDKAFDYYKSVSDDMNVLINLYDEIENAYVTLKTNPFFQIRSKHYRALPLKKYPYLIFFEVLEKERIVKVLSFFNTPQDHKKWI